MKHDNEAKSELYPIRSPERDDSCVIGLGVRRVAKERQITMSRALVALAERGVRAEAEAKEQLKASYNRFLAENDPARKNEAGRDLIRTIFGKDSTAEDSVF